MDIDKLNARLNELYAHKKQLEVQLFQLDGHIQELQFIIHEHVKGAVPIAEDKKEEELTDKEYVDNEMQVM